METSMETRQGNFLQHLKSIAIIKRAPSNVEEIKVDVQPPMNGKALRRKRKRNKRKERKRMEYLLNGETKEVFNKCGYKSEIEVIKPYYNSFREKWPENDILCTVTSIELSSKLIINEIKKIDVGVSLNLCRDTSCRSLRNILKIILKRHIQAPYKHMAWHYARLGMAVQLKEFKRKQSHISDFSDNVPYGAGKEPCKSLLHYADSVGNQATQGYYRNNFDLAVHNDKILQFLHACVRHSIPFEFFGSKHNYRYFKSKWLPVLAGIPGKKSVGLGYLMHRIKVSQVKWSEDVSIVGGRGLRACLVAKTWLWLLLKYLGIILSCHFVMLKTSGEGHGGRQFVFFARRVWNYLKRSTIESHIDNPDQNSGKRKCSTGWAISLITSDKKEEILKENGSPLPAYLQLKPKKNSMRPVLAVKFLHKDELKLHACLVLLEFLASNFRERSTSHNTIDDVCKAWAILYEKKKTAEKNFNDQIPIYGVTVDVKDAFGCVLHNKLCEVLGKKLEEAKLNHQTVLMLKVTKHLIKLKNGNTYKIRYELVGLPATAIAAENTKGREVSVLHREPFQILELYEFLVNCMKYQIVQSGKNFYLLTRGIAQGNPLSYFFWKIYCDSMEDEHLVPYLSVSEGAATFSYLIRGVDDYLFLSESKDEAKWFLERMSRGFPDYNIQVRAQKNFTTLSKEETSNIEQVKVKNSIGLKFWGLTLDPANLLVFADYGGPPARDLRDAYYLYVLKNPKRILESRAILGRLKLNPILLNVNYCGYDGVASNIYRAALMQASYFHAAVKIVFTFQNQAALIELLSRKVCSLSSRIINILDMNQLNKSFVRNEIFWLIYNAYKKVLCRYGGIYPGVIKVIKWLIRYYSRIMHVEKIQILKEVVESCNHSNDRAELSV